MRKSSLVTKLSHFRGNYILTKKESHKIDPPTALIPFQNPLIAYRKIRHHFLVPTNISWDSRRARGGEAAHQSCSAISSRVMKISPYDDVKRRIKLKDSLLGMIPTSLTIGSNSVIVCPPPTSQNQYLVAGTLRQFPTGVHKVRFPRYLKHPQVPSLDAVYYFLMKTCGWLTWPKKLFKASFLPIF